VNPGSCGEGNLQKLGLKMIPIHKRGGDYPRQYLLCNHAEKTMKDFNQGSDEGGESDQGRSTPKKKKTP